MEENLTKQTQQCMSEAWASYQFLRNKKKFSVVGGGLTYDKETV